MQENGPFRNIETEDDLTLSSMSNSQMSATTTTVNFTSTQAGQLEVNDKVEAKSAAVKMNVDGMEATTNMKVTNIVSAALGVGIGVLHYNTSTNEIRMSTTSIYTLQVEHTGESRLQDIVVRETDSSGTILLNVTTFSGEDDLENAVHNMGTIPGTTATSLHVLITLKGSATLNGDPVCTSQTGGVSNATLSSGSLASGFIFTNFKAGATYRFVFTVQE